VVLAFRPKTRKYVSLPTTSVVAASDREWREQQGGEEGAGGFHNLNFF
jgi:hypothetical protein